MPARGHSPGLLAAWVSGPIRGSSTARIPHPSDVRSANSTNRLVPRESSGATARRSDCSRDSRRWSSASPRTARRAGGAVGWLFGSRDHASTAQGLYIYGDVGRGKTMLMDLFFEASPVVRKRRAHFHEFMADVHERVRVFRQKLKDGEIEGEDADPARRRRDRRGELAALLRRIPRHRHRRRHDPRPAVRAAVRTGRGGGGDLERGAVASSTATGSTARCSCRSSP